MSVRSRLWTAPSASASLSTKGKQDVPPSNVPLWYKDYFWLKTNEKEQIQQELPDLSYLPISQACISPCEGSIISYAGVRNVTFITGDAELALR